jgi:hypothetical protein
VLSVSGTGNPPRWPVQEHTFLRRVVQGKPGHSSAGPLLQRSGCHRMHDYHRQQFPCLFVRSSKDADHSFPLIELTRGTHPTYACVAIETMLEVWPAGK